MDNAAACVDQPIAEGPGDETALVTAARRVTYAELSALVDRAAHALRARGVEPEQRGALLLPDGVGFAAAFFAAIKIGAVAGPLNTRLASGDLHAILSDCRPKVRVADADAAQAGYRAFKKYFQGVQPGRTAAEAAPPGEPGAGSRRYRTGRPAIRGLCRWGLSV